MSLTAADKRRTPFSKVVQLVRRKKATLNTTEKQYHANKGRVEIICSQGHKWNPLLRDIISRGFWCPKCAQLKNDQCKRLDIKLLQKIAKERGGKLISNTYTNNSTKVEWECAVGHSWKSVPASVLGNKNTLGTWCPYCKMTSRSEAICRIYLETMFGLKFIKSRPKWLKGSKGLPLELDGYCEELQLAFEHQGAHHYNENFRFFKKSTQGLKERDELKRKLCQAQGVSLIEIPELNTKLPIAKLENYLLSEIKEFKKESYLVPYQISPELYKKSWGPRHNQELEKAKEASKSKGGRCLSTEYISSRSNLLWECSKKHQWQAPLNNILSVESWCPICAGNQKPQDGLKKAQNLAKKHGGLCLSVEYVNARQKMKWKCKDGHEWETAYDAVRSGKWCGICRRKETAQKLRSSIEEMQQIAKTRNGKCLSSEHINMQTPLKWECEKGHQWMARPGNVKTGNWCRKCSYKRLNSSQSLNATGKFRESKRQLKS